MVWNGMSEDQSTVLLVEDEPLLRLFVSELLEESGFKVIEAANASDALAILHSRRIVNVLLTDVDMASDCNGFELAHIVCKSFPGIEILILSGRRWPAAGDLPPGAAFLAKPCPNEAIVSHVVSASQRAKRQTCSASVPTDGGQATIIPFPKTA
jgi:DNA-binding NtrC family response regulator